MIKNLIKIISLFMIASSIMPQIILADTIEISDEKLLEVQISNYAPTRISFENQKIIDVFFYPEEAAKIVLHKSGIVFVVPNNENTQVYITLSTEKGEMQDLRLKFKEIEPKPIKLTIKKFVNSSQDKIKDMSLILDYVPLDKIQLIDSTNIFTKIPLEAPKKKLKFQFIPWKLKKTPTNPTNQNNLTKTN